MLTKIRTNPILEDGYELIDGDRGLQVLAMDLCLGDLVLESVEIAIYCTGFFGVSFDSHGSFVPLFGVNVLFCGKLGSFSSDGDPNINGQKASFVSSGRSGEDVGSQIGFDHGGVFRVSNTILLFTFCQDVHSVYMSRNCLTDM